MTKKAHLVHSTEEVEEVDEHGIVSEINLNSEN